MTSSEITADMRIGWNLGNSLECYNSPPDICCETYWGNPVTSENIILDVRKKGFNAVRIPVSWNEHTNSSNIIDPEWLARVRQVTDFVLNNGMYAIINVHHDDYSWLSPSFENQKEVSTRYEAIWKQICSCFENYGEKLLFEAMNEPRIIGSENEWTCGTPEARKVINDLLEIFCRTVRNSGGIQSHEAYNSYHSCRISRPDCHRRPDTPRLQKHNRGRSQLCAVGFCGR